jgi:hypothetical protein
MRSPAGIAAVSVAATIGALVVGAAPAAVAQGCQPEQACRGSQIQPDRQTQAGRQPEAAPSTQCRASIMNHMCAKPGNAQLQSWPNPAIIPPVPVTIPPWQVLGAPGEGRYP